MGGVIRSFKRGSLESSSKSTAEAQAIQGGELDLSGASKHKRNRYIQKLFQR